MTTWTNSLVLICITCRCDDSLIKITSAINENSFITTRCYRNLCLCSFGTIIVNIARVATVCLSVFVRITAKAANYRIYGCATECTCWTLLSHHICASCSLDWTVVTQWTTCTHWCASCWVIAYCARYWVHITHITIKSFLTHLAKQSIYAVIVIKTSSTDNWRWHCITWALVMYATCCTLVDINETCSSAISTLWASILSCRLCSFRTVVTCRANNLLTWWSLQTIVARCAWQAILLRHCFCVRRVRSSATLNCGCAWSWA